MTSVGVRILIVSAVLSMAGCASYAQRYAQTNEKGLKAAGFEKRLAFNAGKEATGWAPIFSRSGSQPDLCWR